MMKPPAARDFPILAAATALGLQVEGHRARLFQQCRP